MARSFGAPPTSESICSARPSWDPTDGPDVIHSYLGFFERTSAHFSGGRDIPISLHHKNAAYRYADNISENVLLYRRVQGHESTPRKIALKFMPAENNEEVRALALMNERGIFMPWRVLEVPKKPFVYMAMPCFDGTLLDYLKRKGRIPTSVILNIMSTCLKELRMLWECNLSYMDVKITNVLYNACGSSMGIMFGDIGSIDDIGEYGGAEDEFKGILEEGHPYISSSYPRPTDLRVYGVRQTVRGMLWSTAVLGIHLMPTDVTMYGWKKVHDTKIPTRILEERLAEALLETVRAQHRSWHEKEYIVRAFRNLVYPEDDDFESSIRGLDEAEAMCDGIR